MQKIYLLFLILVFGVGCTETKNAIHLHGYLKDMGSQEVVMRYDGAVSLVGDSRDIVLRTNEAGFFDTVIPLAKPEFYSISRNTLYLTPGDDMEVFITTSNKDAVFEGIGAEANNYMKGRLFPKGGSFLEAGGNVKADFAMTKQIIDSLADIRRVELKALKQVSDEFSALEGARITADVINSYICYGSYADEFYRLPEEEQRSAVEAHMKNIASDVNALYKELTDEKLLDIAVVRDVLSYQSEDEYDWFAGITLPERTRELFAAYEQAAALRSEINMDIVNSANQFLVGVKNSDIATELNLKVSQLNKLLPGQPAFDFTMEDVQGGIHKLSDFKGKIIYLDLWATWCGPCIAESPAFEALAEKYKDKEVEFVAVSTDTQKSAWLEYLSAHDKKLTQYNSTDRVLKADWCIVYIPRFILINKDFTIIDSYAPRPSTDEAVAALDSLLN